MAPKPPLAGEDCISITKDMVLREIMYHEFSSHRTLPSGAESVSLDEAKLRAYLRGLSKPQLEFLINHKPQEGASDRLVVFIEQTHRASQLIGADFCNPPANTQARANATFAVFHCRRDEAPVLLCFTEEMCLASHLDMPSYFKPKNQRIQKDSVLKICAMVPLYVDAFNVWHRIVTAQGVDVMPGAPDCMCNSVHGEINTAGCWMLFRNFNWPREQFEAFEAAYRSLYRNNRDAEFRERLRELGYATNDVCTDENLVKAIQWDRNRAYSRFVRHIVGVQYFSRNRFHSLYNSAGRHFHPVATQAYADAVVPGNNGHAFKALLDSDQREARAAAEAAGIRLTPGGRIITAPDSLFDDSRLHFKRQQRWAPPMTKQRVTDVEECSWADLLLFR